MKWLYVCIFIILLIDGNLTGGVNYVAGPYNATFRWRQRISSEFAITIITDPTYTGDKYFSLMINDSRLPVPLVACEDNTENVTICDNECKYYNVVLCVFCMFSSLSCLNHV